MSDITDFAPGECRYCGQLHNINAGFDDPDEQATLQCNCDMAVDYQSYRNAIKQIEDLFDDDAIVEYVKYQAERVYKNLIVSVIVSIDPKIKVKYPARQKTKSRSSVSTQQLMRWRRNMTKALND